MKKLLYLLPILFLFSCRKEKLAEYCSEINFEINEKLNGGSTLQPGSYSVAENDKTKIIEKTNINSFALSPSLRIQNNFRKEVIRPYTFKPEDQVYKMRRYIPVLVSNGINHIMMKPLTSFPSISNHINSSFWGDYYAQSEEEWLEVQQAYEKLYLAIAELSLEFPEFKLLSIGTELKQFTKRRPEFFKALIQKIRTINPNLKLTYAANWDEYDQITFWDDLDYIGVNAYFPLVNKATPTVHELKEAFVPIKKNIKNIACLHNKPVVFTEYGYRSIDYAAWESWKLGQERHGITPNYKIQNNAYQAFFETFWNEKWVKGGYFWEWFSYENQNYYIPNDNDGWGINNKPVEKIIKKWYSK